MSQMCATNLTEEQQKRLEPKFQRLSWCFKFGAACCCCTACFSFVPYWLYSRRVLRHVKRLEQENVETGDGDKSLSIDARDIPEVTVDLV